MDKQTNIALRKTLDQIGASHSLKGYTYTIRAIEKCLDDRDALRCVMKEIYAKIAEENGTTASKVERNIRNLIEVTWINGNVNAINEIFGYTVSPKKGKPTNSEFIAVITDFVSFHGQEIESDSYKWRE
jgi:two-component system response regulator (stage 0 sporulation protein A)